MYKYIGDKIKILAICGFIVTSTLYIACGMYLIFSKETEITTKIIGLAIAIVGSFGSWVSGLIIYGFGELVEKVTSIEAYIKQPENELKDLVEKQLEEGMEEEAPYYSPENYQVDDICSK